MTDNLLQNVEGVLERIRQKDIELFSWGNDADIYEVGDSALIKIFNDTDSRGLSKRTSKDAAIFEYKIGTFLYRNSLHVPEFYDLVTIDEERYGIVMEKVNGKKYLDVFCNHREEMVKQFYQEIKLAYNLGIIPQDKNYHDNALFNSENMQIYLIDFARWRVANKSKYINPFPEL
jgi:RIO-like serine/threonine protein kinase